MRSLSEVVTVCYCCRPLLCTRFSEHNMRHTDTQPSRDWQQTESTFTKVVLRVFFLSCPQLSQLSKTGVQPNHEKYSQMHSVCSQIQGMISVWWTPLNSDVGRFCSKWQSVNPGSFNSAALPLPSSGKLSCNSGTLRDWTEQCCVHDGRKSSLSGDGASTSLVQSRHTTNTKLWSK